MKSKICFFDDYFIASRQGTHKRYFLPKKFCEVDDKGFKYQTYTSFFYDTKYNKYRAYIEVPSPDHTDTEIRILHLIEADTLDDFANGKYTVTPVKGLENCVHGSSVIYNPDADVYVWVGDSNGITFKSKLNSYLCCMTSKDGIHFENEREIYHGYSDTLNSLCYNPYSKEYVVTMRAVWGDRRVWIVRSKDLNNWSEPEILMYPTENADSGMQYYALGVGHCGGIFYGLLWRYMTDLNKPDFTDMAGYMENDLLYSIDGIHFNKTPLAPVCDRPLPPEFGCKQMWMQNVAEDEKNTILFGSAVNIMHGGDDSVRDKVSTSVIYTIRKDGFCAIEGVSGNSEIYTKNLAIYGDEITLNFNAFGGKITYALVGERGEEIEGFSFAECVPFENEESVGKKLEWKNADWSKVRNLRVRIAIKFPGCLIYSISLDCGLWTMWPQEGINLPYPKKDAYK